MSRPLRKPHYQWPPPRDPQAVRGSKDSNAIHSILTALPVIMLVAGLWFYFNDESEQNEGVPIVAESIEAVGIFTGLSEVASGSSRGRYYLWFEDHDKARGVRVQAAQIQQLDALERGVPIRLRMAPTVSGSRTYWLLYVDQAGKVYINNDH